MARLEDTLNGLAPGVASFIPKAGSYGPRKGLAIYYLRPDGTPLTAPGTVLGEALASRSGLGCTMLEGVPAVVPTGAVVMGLFKDLQALRPDLVAGLPVPAASEYVVNIGSSVLIAAAAREGLINGMQTMAMVILRHQDDVLPAGIIHDRPLLAERGVAIELSREEIALPLLFQIVSFISTFKANALDWILPGDFSSAGVRDLDPVIQICHSFGVRTTVRLPWLGRILRGELGVHEAWSHIRVVARLFGASRAALDDPYLPGTPPALARELVDSAVNGDHGLEALEVDARLIEATGSIGLVLSGPGVRGWHRLDSPGRIPDPVLSRLPLRVEVPGNLPGLSAERMEDYFARLDAAGGWLTPRRYQSLVVSFRNLGVSHAWQNLLSPVATGLIRAWGVPPRAEEAGRSYAELLYGAGAGAVIDVWQALSAAFPPGLSGAGERRLREIAYGDWPESVDDMSLLADIDWQGVVRNVNLAAEKLENAAAGLSRNKSTLSGSHLSLQLLAWLCRLSVLLPEVMRRRRGDGGGDGRTGAMAEELANGFEEWRLYLTKLQEESGFEIVEMGRVESMGTRLRAVCGGAFG